MAMEGPGSGKECALIVAMEGDVEEAGVLGGSELGAVAMVNVPIKDQHSGGHPTAKEGERGYGDGIEVTEARGLIGLSVMTWGMN